MPASARAYSWPVKPFGREHAVRGSFADPRFHLDAEGALSSFHFGVDIAVPDGTPVYAVEPGWVVQRRSTLVTVRRLSSGRSFGYWHIRPVVRSGTHVRLHQLLGYVLPGWGHVHFAETVRGAYRNPLRPGALTPYYDREPPVIESIRLLAADGSQEPPDHLTGTVSLEATAYDLPTVPPQPPWQVARLAPAAVWWVLWHGSIAVESGLSADFALWLPPNALYNWIYAPGTYQNKAFRPGNYLFWLDHGLDTTSLADGTYRLEVSAVDTRGNIGAQSLDLTVANGRDAQAPQPNAPGLSLPQLRPS